MYRFKALELTRQRGYVKRFIRITAMILLVFTALLFLPWQQTVKGEGRLTSLDPTQRDYDIVATYDGVIEAFYVKENQFVRKGQKLFSLRDLDREYHKRLETILGEGQRKYDNEHNRLENLRANLENQKRIYRKGLEIYQEKSAQFRNTIEALKQQLSALRNKEEMEKINYRRSRSLYKDGIESKRDMELKQNIYLTTQAAHRKLEADLANAEHQLEITQKEEERFRQEMEQTLASQRNTLLATQNSMHTITQQLEREKSNVSRLQQNEVKAKSDGYVTRIYQNDKNRMLKRGERILHFSPVVTQRALRLKVSDFNMPLIKAGLRVRILFHGWPALQISGWPKISHGTYGGVIHSIERTSHEKGLYYALVVPDEADDPWPGGDMLRIGTQATVFVRLGTVPIWYEIWRLMASQPPRMITPQAEVVEAVTAKGETVQ